MVAAANKRENLTKEDIVKNISSHIGISTAYSANIINDLINILISALISKKKLKIKNFGSFNLRLKKERIGRNPKNNKLYNISARIVASFKAAEQLKLKINKNVKK